MTFTRSNAPGSRCGRPRCWLSLWLSRPEVELTYATADRKLLRFRGIGTIRDSARRNQNVRIEFPAGPNTTGVAQSEIDVAASMPLASGCKSYRRQRPALSIDFRSARPCRWRPRLPWGAGEKVIAGASDRDDVAYW